MTTGNSEQKHSENSKNADSESSNRNKLKTLIQNHTKTVTLALLGVLSAALIPIWQIYVVQTSEIKIEISSIDRIEDDLYQVPLETDELQLLSPYIDEVLLYEFDNQGNKGDKISYPTFHVSTLWNAYEKAKQDQKNVSGHFRPSVFSS